MLSLKTENEREGAEGATPFGFEYVFRGWHRRFGRLHDHPKTGERKPIQESHGSTSGEGKRKARMVKFWIGGLRSGLLSGSRLDEPRGSPRIA